MAKNVIEILDSTGAKVAQLDGRECNCTTYRKINAEWTCSLKYPIPLEAALDKSSLLLATFARIRIRNIDNAAGTDYQTFIITKAQRVGSAGNAPAIVAEGTHIAIYQLNSEIVTASGSFNNATVTAAVAKVLGYSTFFAAGTISPTDKITLVVSWESVLSALQKILEACGSEFDVDEAAGLINISKNLGANNSVYLRQDKNIKTIETTDFNRDVVNKIYGVGGGQPPATIAGARHVVSGYVSGTGVLTVDNNKVVAENDSWNTNYEVYFVTGAEAGNYFTITDCAHGAANDTLTIDTGQTIAAGDKFTIRTTAHVEVNFIRAGGSIASYGQIQGVYKNGKWLDAVNLVKNPAMDAAYSSGLCAGWTKEGTPTVTKNATETYIQYGAASQRVQGTDVLQGVSQVVPVVAARYYSISAWVYLVSGSVKLRCDDDGDANNFQEAEIAASDVGVGWQELKITGMEIKGTGPTISVMQSVAGTSEFYVDAVQVTEGETSYGFTENCDSLNLWRETFDQLIKVMEPPVQYRVTFVDLFKISPADYPFDEISIGDTVTIFDTELSLSNVTARVKEINQDVFNPERTEHTISNI